MAEKNYLSSRERELRPMTLTFEFDLDRVKMNNRAKCLRERSFNLIVIVSTHRQTHGTDRLLCIDLCSVSAS